MQELRLFQQIAMERLREKFREGLRRIVLTSPTGSGKSTIAAHMIAGAVARGMHVVAIAHRQELIDQLHERIAMHGIEAGIIMADEPARPDLPVQVASIQTLTRRKNWPKADLLILDEARHSAARSYRRLFETYANAWTIGLDATPIRLDGLGLKGLYEDSVLAATPAELIRDGYLCGYTGFCYVVPDVSGIKSRGGDYEQEGLTLACSQPQVIGSVVDEWLKHASGMKTVCFAVTIAHAQALAHSFREKGVAAVVVDHTLPREERRTILAKLHDGSIRMVVNVGIFGEGVDVPTLECGLLCRPTKSLAVYLQQVGRLLRPAPGKEKARIHDHSGNVLAHGLPDATRDWSLQADAHKEAKQLVKLDPLRTCKGCFAIFPTRGNPACPVCGEVWASEPRKIRHVDGQARSLESMRGLPQFQVMPTEKRRSVWERLKGLALAKGYKPGWARVQYRVRFGTWPIW